MNFVSRASKVRVISVVAYWFASMATLRLTYEIVCFWESSSRVSKDIVRLVVVILELPWDRWFGCSPAPNTHTLLLDCCWRVVGHLIIIESQQLRPHILSRPNWLPHRSAWLCRRHVIIRGCNWVLHRTYHFELFLAIGENWLHLSVIGTLIL